MAVTVTVYVPAGVLAGGGGGGGVTEPPPLLPQPAASIIRRRVSVASGIEIARRWRPVRAKRTNTRLSRIAISGRVRNWGR